MNRAWQRRITWCIEGLLLVIYHLSGVLFLLATKTWGIVMVNICLYFVQSKPVQAGFLEISVKIYSNILLFKDRYLR